MTLTATKRIAMAPGFGGESRRPEKDFGGIDAHGPLKKADISQLLFKRKSGTDLEKLKADVEIVRRVMQKEGDPDKKGELLYTLVLEVYLVGARCKPDDTKESYVRLAESLASGKEFGSMVREASVRLGWDYERRLASYKLDVERRGPEKAFMILAESSADYVAIQLAMLVRGARDAFKDAEAYMGNRALYELVGGFANFLINPRGGPRIAQIREQNIDSKVRNFLRQPGNSF